MPNLIEVNYGQTGQSTNTDALGMREMQARVYAKRDAQHLLVKAPPASGKSRALMFLALDKMHQQSVTKTIVAVRKRSIAASFAPTHLSAYGSPSIAPLPVIEEAIRLTISGEILDDRYDAGTKLIKRK